MIVLNTQCIEEYDPGLNADVDLLTVNASIVRGHEEQIVVITRSTPLDDTQYKAVENCNVFVTDDRDNKFQFEEISAGKYVARIDSSYLNIGAKFKLTIETPDDNLYESDYEEIHDCPPVGNLYFIRETNYSKKLNRDINGLRLYTDLLALEGYTGYYRWKINETWEYRSPNDWIDAAVEVEYVVAEPVVNFFNKPDSLHYCWNTAEIQELYSTRTTDLITNGKKQVQLHHVFGYDERLKWRYSCLLSQYSLNEGAYHYWHNKKVEIQESGGIHFTQPNQTVSNIRNINNDQETVLGYFWTSTVKHKRVFFDGPFDFDLFSFSPCNTDTFDINNYYPGGFPVYTVIKISDESDITFFTARKSCFDCRTHGGTINRPDYW